jgi:hypothetical protein
MSGQPLVVWDRAQGFQVHDLWGNTWLDFTSTIFVTNAGHANPRIVEALREQLDKPLLHTYTFASKVRADYLRYLIEITPDYFEKAFLLSAGTEASECGLKLMRMHAWKSGKRRPGIIAFEGNWHGRTLGAQMMSYNPAQKEWIGFKDPNIYHLPFPYPWREEAVSDPRGYFRNSINALMEEDLREPALKPCISGVEDNNSFPSGHATYGYVIAYLLIEMVPEKRTELLRRAATFAHSRALCGVHYPSDLVAGKQAGAWLSQRILQDPGYRAAAEVASRELRAALKMPPIPIPN